MQVNRIHTLMVTFSDSFIAFLLDEKRKGSDIARLIIGALEHRNYYPIYDKIITTKEVDYITMRPDGLLSYLPAGKEHKVNGRGEWIRDNRQSGKPAKVIRKVFTEKMQHLIPNKSFEAFGNAYKAKFMDNGFTFEIKPNVEIPVVYNMRRADGDASLNNSCMNGDGDYMKIYTNCPHLRILILTNKNGSLCGRALLWNLTHQKYGDITFMDRVYVVEDYMYDLFIDQAKTNGWWRKAKFRSYDNKQTWVHPETDESVSMSMTVYTSTDFDYYPYIDTFSYGGDGYLCNAGGQYTYDCTNGTRSGEPEEEQEDDHAGEVWDEFSDRYIPEDDAVFLEYGERRYRGRYTHVDNCVQAYYAGLRQEWFHEDDSNIVDIGGTMYHMNHEDVVRRADGEYDLQDNCVQCETDNEWYELDADHLIQSEDGLYYDKYEDSNVARVQPLNGKGSKRYVYLPDVPGQVIVGADGKYYWAEDKRLKQVEDTNDHCSYWCLNIDVIKWGRRRFYKEDRALIELITNTTTR